MATAEATGPVIEQRSLAQKMGLAAICGVIFFSVSGGPYGLEDTIGESGAGMGLLLILVTPIIFSLPTALMVAELGTAMPVEGGYYHWAKTALGDFWGFQSGWWSWVVSWVDMALYPVLFVEYASYFDAFKDLRYEGGNPLTRWLVAMAVVWGFGLLNMRGSKLVGDSSKLFLVIVIAPFVLLTVWGLFKMDQNPFEPFKTEGLGFGPAFGAGLFVVMWNYLGWDGLSTVAGEIDNPKRNYPRALAITIPLITAVYFIPTIVSLSVLGPNDVEWTAGAYTLIAEEVAGKWLGITLAIAAMVSAVGLFSAWLLSNSRIPFALADDGYLPPKLAEIHPRWGTPWVSILICCAITSIFVLGPFQTLVVVDVTIYSFALALEFASLVALRWRHPDMARPFRVPGGWIGVVLVCIFPLAVVALAVYYQVLDVGLVQGIGWALAGVATGPIAYLVLRPYKKRNGVDRTYTIDMINRGEFETEIG